MSDKRGKNAINDTCPWSGKPVHPDALVEYDGQTVGFCSKEHSAQFKRAVDHFEDHIKKASNPGRPSS